MREWGAVMVAGVHSTVHALLIAWLVADEVRI